MYDKVCKDRDEEDRPPYFKFLTILAFNIFWRENVDVAIIEVGIGGEYDCTNIIPRPVVTGISSLGLDHTSLLGNTITDIAWHKAGIMKRGVACYVDPHQKDEALEVIRQRGRELGGLPSLVPPLGDLSWPGGSPPKLGLYGEVQQHNASLALALASHFLSVTGDADSGDTTEVSEAVVRGLELTEWPGRSQTVVRGGAKFYLDGAHTEESMESCVAWFRDTATRAADTRPVCRVLVFNTTGDREVRALLAPLARLQLDLVIFTTNIARGSDSATADQTNYNTNYQMQLSRCDTHARVWAQLSRAVPSVTVACYDDAVSWVTAAHCPQLRREEYRAPGHAPPPQLARADTVEVLVTGSLHLVGGVLGFIS